MSLIRAALLASAIVATLVGCEETTSKQNPMELFAGTWEIQNRAGDLINTVELRPDGTTDVEGSTWSHDGKTFTFNGNPIEVSPTATSFCPLRIRDGTCFVRWVKR